ncbi:SMI1/KNR4 family protein [Cytophagaceae bacterium YF14B1]|uniref:SMI1/KNR4 family protein n=1 Tax=Xanthocytophaga flava TaxID=3048013 RepID=A0AAE3QT95_9BACT|nr:SMI1/KNR4 family protein [Xanthocytophaga flavus]MDJ1485037.1 SMI1/KNR4 family protein [Xanthocytophaga flavus]
MTDLNLWFHEAYAAVFPRHTVYSDKFPVEMKASEEDSEGWIEWKLLKGTLQASRYHQVEKQFGVLFPESFIDWHKSYYFLDGDCSIIRLPASNPSQPLEELKRSLDWYVAQQLIPQQLYPFAEEGNDTGPLVFDGREKMPGNEFPIRVYDHEFGGELQGLSPIIFSSFSKLLECLTHYLTQLKTRRNFEIIPDFFTIDPQGAGKTGVDYWLGWSGMQSANFERFGY